jgi:hypothetical protein
MADVIKLEGVNEILGTLLHVWCAGNPELCLQP